MITIEISDQIRPNHTLVQVIEEEVETVVPIHGTHIALQVIEVGVGTAAPIHTTHTVVRVIEVEVKCPQIRMDLQKGECQVKRVGNIN